MSEMTSETLNLWLLSREGDMQEGFDHADAWAADRAHIEALEIHEVEFKWLLAHDSGDMGGVGRKQWIERRDTLLLELAALTAKEET